MMPDEDYPHPLGLHVSENKKRQERASLAAPLCSAYRLLDEKDVVRWDDEYLDDDCETWRRVNNQAGVGQAYSYRLHQPMRRMNTPNGRTELSPPDTTVASKKTSNKIMNEKTEGTAAISSSEFVRLLLRMADDLEISEHLKPYADRARDAARRIETMDKALDAQASTMRMMAHKSCEYEAALDATLECSNGHYNPLFRCGCYERAHNLIMRKQPNVLHERTPAETRPAKADCQA